MSQARGALIVTDFDGLRGTIEEAPQELHRSGQEQVVVRFENGQQIVVSTDKLIQRQDGSFFLPFSISQPERRQAQGDRDEETLVVPVVAEKLEVQKRVVEREGVRIRKIVREHEEVVDEPLMHEEVQVKRVPINRVVDGPIPVRHVGNTMIVSLLEEVLVVEKRLMLKEELHITKEEVETYKPQRVTLRSEEATVERVNEQEQQLRDNRDASSK
ncbi:MAG TPA: YsnF/AvaK domain-containing protein [Pyrinomonadaceae bacterium]|jgi:uncharacterized protein (TIGR02271 family)